MCRTGAFVALFCATAEVLPPDVTFLGADLAATLDAVVFVPVTFAPVTFVAAAGFLDFCDATAAVPVVP